MYKGKTYVHKQFRTTLTCLHHTSLDVGHPGQAKTIELILRNYWWPTLFTDVKHFVQTCPDCQRTKIYLAKPSGLLQPNPIVEAPWKEISADFITGLPDSCGYNAIMVIVDCFTNMVHAIPTNDTVNLEGMARLYQDNIWKLHGLPDCIISDRGPQFASKFTRDLNKALGIVTALLTAYHPQTDGQMEHMNQNIEQYLCLFVNYRQDDWADWLSIAEFTINN